MRTVTFPVTMDPGFLGRNGYGKATALEILAGTDAVYLTPFTSKGVVARCELRLPNDPATLRAIAAEILFIAEEVARPVYPTTR